MSRAPISAVKEMAARTGKRVRRSRQYGQEADDAPQRPRARKRVASLAAKMARIRKDWSRKVSLHIGRRFGAVVIEDLKISNMTRNAKGTAEEPGKNLRAKAASTARS